MRLLGFIAILLAGPVLWAFQSDEPLEGPTLTKDVIRPVPTYKPEPSYSAPAEVAHVQGIVRLQVVVDEQGRTTDITVLSPLGYGLDERAIDAVSHWRFKPSTRNGVPVKVLANVEVTFRFLNSAYDANQEKQRTAFNVALVAMQQNKVTKVVADSLHGLATQKYGPGLYLYGKILEDGQGVTADPTEGFRLIQESADKQYGPAMYEVAMAHLQGNRLDKDPVKAMDLMRGGARLGSRSAQLFLGQAYEKGDGVPMDFDKSRQNYRLCAAAGDAPCQFGLGKSLIEHSDHPQRDYVQAIAWLQLAAEHGFGDAEKLLQKEDARLTPAQVAGANQMKAQLVHQQ